MSSAPIRLGPFELTAMIGRGGMAEVWRGMHVGQRVPVAIKVITAARAREPHFLGAFKNEVQAVARLHHPAIVLVFDHGEVTEEAAVRSRERILAGSPYLAMELASWGSLDRVKLPLRWEDLLRILLALLDALAHAHARGVVHRDLKPGNILLSSPTDARPGLKLTDFGIAHALDHESRPGKEEASSGTPHFMSPEQFLGHWRDYGPWTDLYAVGCVAHLLASGQLPFTGEGPLQLAWQHINAQPPRLEAEHVPEGFESWVRRLLEKDFRQRFQRAADAGWALLTVAETHRKKHPELPAPESWVFEPTFRLESKSGGELARIGSLEVRSPLEPEPELDPTSVDPTFVGEAATVIESRRIDSKEFGTAVRAHPPAATFPWQDMSNLGRTGSAKLEALSPDAFRAPVLHPRRIPPLPRSWRRATPAGTSMQLVGAGLGLYGLRAIPMVDRETERDMIWQALRAVREKKSARAVLLHGSAGNGKSRLVEWIGQRADEVGSAVNLRTAHGPTPGPNDGLGRMIARHLRCVDLPRAEAHARTAQILKALGVADQEEWDALTELMIPTPKSEHGSQPNLIRFGSATERHVLIRRLLERVSQERPVILWLDDVQWGNDSLAFATHVLKMQRESPAPILMLLTARDEALAERPVESAMIDDLMRLEGASRLHVPPLTAADQRKLVEELLFLESTLARQVVERSGGNPLFAVQLVGDWVARGVLEVAPTGFVLQEGEHAVLPDDIHQIWTMRIQRLLAEKSSAQIALEIAAVLGRDVDGGEWEAACRAAMIEFTPRLIDDLIQNRLAVHVDGGWSFAHGMLRESLERSAIEAGRYELQHRACAKMLEQRYGADSPRVSERIGRHHLAAGDLGASLAPLLRGAEELFSASEFQATQDLLSKREDALRALDRGEDDPAWGEGWVLRARVAVAQGRFQESKHYAETAERQARRWGWRTTLPNALFEMATTAYETGDHLRAMDLFSQASDLYRWNGDALGMARCQLGTADAIYRRGELARSYDQYKTALELFEGLGDEMGMANSLCGMGYVALWKNDLDAAQSLFERQLRLIEGTGDRFRLARCVSALGEVERQAGKHQGAEQYYRRALQIDEAIGSASIWVDHMNLALILLARREFKEARREVTLALEILSDGAVPAQLCVIYCELLPSLADERDWASFDHHLEEASRLLAETEIKDGDVAWTLWLAGERAAEEGEIGRAEAAYRLALLQWSALGRADQEEATRRALEGLSRRPAP